jgi:predicted amidohydrolase YtcJ
VTGEPTGILIDAADDTLRARIPEATPGELDRMLDLAVDEVLKAGLTGVHEMGVTHEFLAALKRAEDEDRLRIRVIAYLDGETVLSKFEGGPQRPEPRALLRVEGVKLYSDGALGSRGAALLEDYSDRPGHRGLLMRSPEALTGQIRRSFERGFGVAIHAIGDRANRISLNALERGHAQACATVPGLPSLRGLRARIEHAQVLSPTDIPRFAELGVLPSMQPTHCTSDMPWAPQRLGVGRLKGAYAWRSLRDVGCILPLGSDFPVESHSPLRGIYAARTRQTPEGSPKEGWTPEQRLTAREALLGYTVWPASACGVQAWGRLEPGYRGDVTVISEDPLADDPSRILRCQVLLTIVEGKVRYAALPTGP